MICRGSSDGEDSENFMFRPAMDSLVGFAEQSQARLVTKAELWLTRFRLDTIELSAEAAVHAAWLALLERSQRNGIHAIRSAADFERIFTLLLRHVILDERRRQNARKRARRVSALDPALEVVDSQSVRPDEHVIGQHQVEWLLSLLNRAGPSLREIAVLKMQGFSNGEIASEQAVSINTIERKLREIRSILGPYADHRENP